MFGPHRNGLVDSAQPRTLGIELRIALVGPHQDLRQGFRPRRLWRQEGQHSNNGSGQRALGLDLLAQ